AVIRAEVDVALADPDASAGELRETAERVRADGEDFDGLIEHARSIEGSEVALLFRETEDGKTKISFRSNGHADVNRLARMFGGGGHVKAAGALVDDRAEKVVPPVIAAVRDALLSRARGPAGTPH
ncbi:MAG TPA: DHHA1 domain-containing protein, partial [Longimicrobiaceae bacterium]|nr:DHHA1 domain-containing protein [Longimicrobiaceae bacterium]